MAVRELVNPLSTRAAEWWCHSALRGVLIGHRLHRLPRREPTFPADSWVGFAPSPVAHPDRVEPGGPGPVRDR